MLHHFASVFFPKCKKFLSKLDLFQLSKIGNLYKFSIRLSMRFEYQIKEGAVSIKELRILELRKSFFGDMSHIINEKLIKTLTENVNVFKLNNFSTQQVLETFHQNCAASYTSKTQKKTELNASEHLNSKHM